MGGISLYTFNTTTSKFEAIRSYNYQTFNCGTDLEFIGSNTNVIQPTSADTTKVFFQITPVPGKVYIKPTLMETVQKALEELIKTIIINLEKIIPIGLVILSIGLLILLIKSVISRAT